MQLRTVQLRTVQLRTVRCNWFHCTQNTEHCTEKTKYKIQRDAESTQRALSSNSRHLCADGEIALTTLFNLSSSPFYNLTCLGFSRPSKTTSTFLLFLIIWCVCVRSGETLMTPQSAKIIIDQSGTELPSTSSSPSSSSSSSTSEEL